MKKRMSVLVLVPVFAAPMIACVVDFGCDGRHQLERKFFRESADTRIERFRRYALPEQYQIFLYALRREPPNLELADPIAGRGESAISFLTEQLNTTTDDRTVDGVLLIFEAMARTRIYNVRGDAALMNLLASKASAIKDDFWRAEATKTLESIKRSP